MVKQAALKAAKDNAKCVTMEHLDFARDKILMGMLLIQHFYGIPFDDIFMHGNLLAVNSLASTSGCIQNL